MLGHLLVFVHLFEVKHQPQAGFDPKQVEQLQKQTTFLKKKKIL